MHHAAAENLKPLIAFADPDLVADLGVADVHFHRRLGEGEVARAEAHLHLRHFEERLAEFLEHPFQMPEMSLLVDGEPLDLVEHRRMGLVRVAAIDASRRDDAERRLLLQHGADLHRARMGAKHRPRAVRPFGEIERVVILPRRMLGRNVERGEIVEVGLDVRPLGDREAHIGEDLGDLVGDLAHRVDAAFGERAFAHREGNVGPLSREPRAQRSAAKRLALGVQRLSDALFELIDGLAEALALFRRHAPERLHQLRDAALLAERGDAHLFQRAEVAALAIAASSSPSIPSSEAV